MTIIHGVHKKIVSRKVEYKQPNKMQRCFNLNEFYEKRNKVLIIRAVGGLGDIFMHRMMFEDIKNAMEGGELHFACPIQYHDAVKDHPFIDKLIDSKSINQNDYIAFYNTTTACGRYEMRIAPQADLHRSDIWTQHCGFNLTNHNMHIRLTDDEIEEGKKIVEVNRDRGGSVVVVAPVSAMEGKNLLDHQLDGLIDYLHGNGLCAIGLHSSPIARFVKRNLPCLYGMNIRQWMSVINAADYVVSVDTAAFHCSGGLKKPLTGIFTFADGMVYGKYFDFELVQKHRALDTCWTCGPCYAWNECPKTKNKLKPCLTELTIEEIVCGVDKMLKRWGK